jgi:hypothetical protein
MTFLIKKDEMMIMKREQNICDGKKVGELVRIFMTFHGIPSTKCPMREVTSCNRGTKIQLTSVKKIVELFAGSTITFDTKSKHNTVNNCNEFLLSLLNVFSQGESCMKTVIEIFRV